MISYDRVNYNCAHHAVKRLNEYWGLDIKIGKGDEWQRDFVKHLADFTQVTTPCDGALVVMSRGKGQQHLGIVLNWMVEHNYQPPAEFHGCVILSDLGTIRELYNKVRFYVPN